MPLGKYYCDYCDKEFQDNAFARKRHLQSSSHLRAKSLWYKSIDPGPTHSDRAGGFVKGVCNRFVRTGFCPYGDSCKYMHTVNATQGFAGNVPSPVNLGNQFVGGSYFTGDVVRDNMGMSWGNLPPSLKPPPPEEGYPSLPFVDWG